MGRKDKNIQSTETSQIGSRMRLARQSKSLSLTEMSRRLKYTVTYLSAIENGNGRPSPQLVELYEHELELRPGELMRDLTEVGEKLITKYKEGAPQERQSRIDWEEVPDIPHFYGREEELTSLSHLMLRDKCRVVCILGIGGVGKTSLASRLVHQTKSEFEYVFWRSLQSMPPLDHVLKQCILFLSNHELSDFPKNEDDQISMLIACLSDHQCLLVLDNFESLLLESSRVGQYREDYRGYGRLLQRIGESHHQSCLLLTSREKPREIVSLEGAPSLVRSFLLSGVERREAREILSEKRLVGSDEDWSRLIRLYAGNPLSLKLISEPIREIFRGDIAAFLRQGEVVFGDIYDLLAQQLRRVSKWEREILYWLAIEQVASSLQELQRNIVHPIPKGTLLEALDSLQRRSMIVKSGSDRFTLHPVVMEYVTSEFVECVHKEIGEEVLDVFDNYPLVKAQSKDYVRNTQKRLILEPLVDHLLVAFGKSESERKLQRIVSQLQKTHPEMPGYATGNLLNLLIQLRVDLRNWDFSHLVVSQAYLRGVSLPMVNFSYANLSNAVFTETFGSILSVAFSSDSQLLAAGTVTGEIRTWLVSGGVPALTFQGHTNWVWSVAYSPDGQLLASGSDDQTVRLWAANTGQCNKILEGHSDRVRSVVFSSDGQMLASGSEDGTVRLWKVHTGQCLKILEEQGGQVYAVAFSPDGQMLASGSEDGTVRLWKVHTDLNLASFKGHSSRIYAVAFSPDGQMLASGSEDGTVRLWKVHTGQCLKILEGQGGQVYAVAFSPDGQMLASGSEDGAIGLWEASTGQRRNSFREHTNRIYALAFNPNAQVLASGSNDQTARLWDVSTGQCLDTLQGYTNLVWSVVFNPDGRMLASGSNDQTVRLWNSKTRECLGTLQGHSDRVRSVAFSPDGQRLASGSEDRTVRIWEVNTGQCLTVLEGHSDRVRSVAFSPDGQTLASGGEDGVVWLWEMSTGRPRKILEGQNGQIYAVAFSPDGQILASGSEDGTVQLWEVNGHLQPTILRGHSNKIYAVAFSPDGRTLASGSNDQTVKLWDIKTGQCLATLYEHDVWVYSIAFSPDGSILASGGNEGTIEMWDVQAQQRLKPLKSERPYEGMNITGVKGLTVSQRAMLKALGAFEIVENKLLNG